MFSEYTRFFQLSSKTKQNGRQRFSKRFCLFIIQNLNTFYSKKKYFLKTQIQNCLLVTKDIPKLLERRFVSYHEKKFHMQCCDNALLWIALFATISILPSQIMWLRTFLQSMHYFLQRIDNLLVDVNKKARFVAGILIATLFIQMSNLNVQHYSLLIVQW